jgi:two-component system chemotaxis sensor kinase CheA
MRALVIARELETHGTLVEIHPNVLGDEDLVAGQTVQILLATLEAREDLEDFFEAEDLSSFHLEPVEAEISSRQEVDREDLLQAHVEELAGEFVLADAQDRPAIDRMRDRLPLLIQEGTDAGLAKTVEILRKLDDALGKVVRVQTEEKEEVWKEVLGVLRLLEDSLSQESVSASPAEGPSPVATTPATGPAPAAQESLFSIFSDPDMATCFITESTEHLETAEVHLLTLETETENEEALNAVFRAFHTIKGSAGMLGLSRLSHLAHEAENLLGKAREGKVVLAGRAMDAVFDTVDNLKEMIQGIREAVTSGNEPTEPAGVGALIERLRKIFEGAPIEQEEEEPLLDVSQKLGEALVEAGLVTESAVESALQVQEKCRTHTRVGEILVKSGEVKARDVARTLRAQKSVATAAPAQVKESVKVDAVRLDRLIDMIGELVIAESMVGQSAEIRKMASPQLLAHVAQLEKITRELQEMGTSLRMVPVRSTFQKMARLVRDLARKADKRVDLVMTGEDTELDKTVVDKIGDPLIHMIRNSVDHGIEATVEDRAKMGKPGTGRIDLRAYHKGGNIYIEIQDDGRGLDRDAIHQKGIERGLLREGEAVTDREVFNLIFHPGFSTAKKVTDVSGRGVGMDVVRRNVEALRGQIEISSEAGRGTLFTIRLPLTLAIIDGMVVRVGHDRYIIPTLSIIQSIRPDRSDISTVLNRGRLLNVQGHQLPLFRLADLFEVPDAAMDPTQATVVVVEDDGKRTGLMVDDLIGQQQIVIKPLGELLQGTPGVAGGAIMPDGQVGLILDIAGLIRLADSEFDRGEDRDPHPAIGSESLFQEALA